MEILLPSQTRDCLLEYGECTPTAFTTLAPDGTRSRVAVVLLLMDCGANLLNCRTTIDGDSVGRRFFSDFRCLTWTGLIVRTYASILRGLRCVRRQCAS
eukprot:7379634-Prymnesium_polylepis.1